MICPHCSKETNDAYIKEGAGQCEYCGRIIEVLYEHKEEIQLPGVGRLISTFTEEVSSVLKETNKLFYRIDSKEIVEIGKIKDQTTQEEIYTGFLSMKPNRFITIIEEYLFPGINIKNKETAEWCFKHKSITSELSNTVLASNILQKSLPQITRIFTIPLPIMIGNKITFPKKGYDSRFGSWLPNDAPEISEPEMKLEEAKEIIKEIFKEFCFQDQQDYYNAIAALITPFLRGLFSKFNTRTPVFFYLANRERAGKDYLAGITGLIYDGNNLEEAPISNSEKRGNNNSEELRKKILSAMITGRKRMHFSNNKGHIDNAVFEAVITAEKYSDRILGRSEMLTFDNEIDFSLSGNVGVGFTPDFANRCRMIHLFLEMENANERKFDTPDLHNWVLTNRSKILSAIYSLVRNWTDKGSPGGSLPFASFHEWASVCGGIMETAGYGNPCVITETAQDFAGDLETSNMKLAFEICFERYGEDDVKKPAIIQVIEDNELFPYLDLMNNRSDQTKFGNLLTKFIGRKLSDIVLVVKDTRVRGSRREYIFTKRESERKLVDFEV